MKIKFIASSLEVENFVDCPVPSKTCIPKWYKNNKLEYKTNPLFGNDGKLLNTNIKMCMPFLDAMTGGYIQKTWCDIYIQKRDSEISCYHSSTPKIIGSRQKINTEIYDKEYYPIEFFWYIPWITKTPKNYSVIITHPLGRHDLPFTTISGIIDSDKYNDAPFGNLPFYIKNDFEGLIPSGTPMYQIIPIKRERWSSDIVPYSIKLEKRYKDQMKKFWGYYKNNFWQKKEYL